MKKLGFGRRLIAMLLVLAMVVGYVPMIGARAASVGDVELRDTNLEAGTFNSKDTISWPIKIYDFLNDGMLFDYSSASDSSMSEGEGGSYGGGMPALTSYNDGFPCEDYTTVLGYYNVTGTLRVDNYGTRYAFKNWGNKAAYAVSYDTSAEGATEVERSIVQPVKDVSPMYMRWSYVGTRGTKAYGWISNFAKDEGKYYAKEDVRYMVIVYKTNETYATPIDVNGDGIISAKDADGNASGDYLGNGHAVRPYWSVTDTAYAEGDTVTGVDISDVSTSHGWKSGSNPTGLLVAKEVRIKPSTDKWTYQIIDMKSDGPMSSGQSGYGIAENWDTDVLSGNKVAGIGMSLPLSASGEVMDVSHIAFFGTEELAKYFGMRAVEFDNDPGEYMGSKVTMTHAVSGVATSSYTAPTVSTGLDLTKSTANGGSWGDSAVTDWWNSQGLDVDDAKSHTSGGYYYARITEPYSGLNTAYVKKGSTNYSVSNYRYITLVYRTNIASPKVGFWIERDGYPAGKGFNGTSYADKRVSITQSTGTWKTLVYDIAQINNWDTDYNSLFNGSTLDQIGIMFPGFSSSQYMDIAYVNFASSKSAADTFATNAANYLNNFTVTNNNVDTTVSLSDIPQDSQEGYYLWNTGNNRAFTLLYGSNGGSWSGGGANDDTNGYYTYQIGYNYNYSATGDTNVNRANAANQGKDYVVPDDIFLLNCGSPEYRINVETTTDANGNNVNYIDMSKLELGYTLYNTMKGSGVMTAGLLQSSIVSFTGIDGEIHRIMNYKEDTVHYVATLLRDTLVIPERDYWGYNYNFVKGTASALYCEDWDGDGELDKYNEDLDGDGHLDDVNEDTNGNGQLELSEDIDGDGHLDVYEDLNGNGILDLGEDLDGDGKLDVWEDIDYDGLIDPGEDKDGDGKLDVGEDVDYDGNLDVFEDVNHNGILDEGEDIDGDGHLDVDEDVNGNGILDYYTEDVDYDGHLDNGMEDANGNGELDEGEDLDGDGYLDNGYEDLNGNGKLDRGEDLNGNGKLDPPEDVDGDGYLDMGEIDLNGNGELDPEEDLNGNGQWDIGEDLNRNGVLDDGEDLNGNGILDLEDLNGNGHLDLGEDLDGDGHLDAGEIDLNGNGILDPEEDINGNGKWDHQEDLDGDGRLDVDEDHYGDPNRYGYGNGELDKCDLATALRYRLGIEFTEANLKGKTAAEAQAVPKAKLGSYEETLAKTKGEKDLNGNGKCDPEEDLNGNGKLDVNTNLLIGPYLKCAPCIETFYDASYYLLHNLFVGSSYNHEEDDFDYLVMTKAVVDSEDKEAYVFDAGLSIGTSLEDAQNATVYDKENRSIYQTAGSNKRLEICYQDVNNFTTLFPFLPVDDSGEGVESEFRANGTPYPHEDGAQPIKPYGDSYAARNYNYVLNASGDFVYREGQDLFFDFEGDDDVYMFVNGELVLDIGAAHSITKVSFRMNDYVSNANAVLSTLGSGYQKGMTDELFLDLLESKGITGTKTYTVPSGTHKGETYTAADLLRWHRLNLADGQDYPIDFYYMERHGWGANMRIATNIEMTAPEVTPGKTAHQGTDIYGDPIEIESGELVDDSKPINYSFSLTNKGNTKLYRLAFQDQSIGVDLSANGGLEVYGRPTVSKFTLTETTTMTVTGVDGVMELDGEVYWLAANGRITAPSGEQAYEISIPLGSTASNRHTLKIYQYGSNNLMNDQTAVVTLGSASVTTTPKADSEGSFPLQPNAAHKLTVAGVRVTDANGKKLDPADLTFTITGYASAKDAADNKPIDPITVRVADNIQLKQFLTDLQDPKHQTGEGEGVPEGGSALYWGAGLWQNATVTVSGVWYTLSEEEQEAMVFNNTVKTTAYKSMSSNVPLKREASHIVYCPGDPMYYQWAGNPLHLTLDRFWADVVEASKIEGTTLGTKKFTVEDIDNKYGGIASFAVEICDKNGNQVTVSDNYYDNGKWFTFPGSVASSDPTKRTIYYKHYHDWSSEAVDPVYVYYWSDVDREMVSWPGERDENGKLVGMDLVRVDGDGKLVYKFDIPADAKYVIFNNGDVNNMVQTKDISVPIVDYDKVLWMEDQSAFKVFFDNPGKHMIYVRFSKRVTEDGATKTVDLTVPVTFYVTKTNDKTYVLDYGLKTEELNAGGLLFQNDEYLATELLGNKAFTETKIMGVSTTAPSYMGTFNDDALTYGNINRIDFTKQVMEQDAETGDYYFDLEDGRFYISREIAAAGNAVNYINGNYSANTHIWFQPNKIMDEPYEMWLAITVHEMDAYGPGETAPADDTTPTYYHAPAGKSTTADTTGIANIDIKTEVQMFKKVTVLPATVVYYEDDFADIHYNGTVVDVDEMTENSTFIHHGPGSGSLTQGVEQHIPYGQDVTYQNSANGTMSGDSLTAIDISNTDKTTEFTFKGTGFEIMSHTNSFDSASFVVELIQNGEVKQKLPVITEFTSSASACTHNYHSTKGYCTLCGKDVGHTFVDGVCTGTNCKAKEPTYYLIGNINDKDVDVGNDPVDSTQYPFVDGKLTITFEKDSYVVVKENVNGDQYWTNGYDASANSMVLYNTSKYGSSIAANKLHAPGGVELTFSLVDNGSGAMTLSYSMDPERYGERTVYYDNSVTQWEEVFVYYWANGFTGPKDWPGEPMEQIAGTDIYFFVLPSDANMVIFSNNGANQTGDMTVPGDGYIYSNGVWSVYGESTPEPGPGTPDPDPESNTIKVYFRNDANWTTINAYWWGVDDAPSWPGTAMTQVEGDLYMIEVPKETVNMIFNSKISPTDGGNAQTGNLQVPAADALYTWSTGAWTDLDGNPIVKEEPAEETYTVYFKNTCNWEKVGAHYWNDSTSTTWPGAEIVDSDNDGYYEVEVPVSRKYIIFNNFNNGQQTVNLELPGADGFTFIHDGQPINGARGNWIYPANGEMKTVYLRNTYGWKSFSAWAWYSIGDISVNNAVQYPGAPMLAVPGTEYYAVQIPAPATNIIFTDGTDAHKVEATLDDSKPTYEGNQWIEKDPTKTTDRKIYYKNVNKWEKVYVYVWAKNDGDLMNWEDLEMDPVGNGFYGAVIPNDAKYVVFHNGDDPANGGFKTVNIHDSLNAYNGTSWITYVNFDGQQIHQVPAIRLDGLEYGTYTVRISGMPQYEDTIDWNKVIDLRAAITDAVSDAAKAAAQKELDDYLAQHLKKTYLYIDGIRIYQPIASMVDGEMVNGTHDLYGVNENSAAFKELRSLILEGNAAVVRYVEGSTEAYTGNYSWSENRNGILYDLDADVANGKQNGNYVEYVGNKLDSINDYMLVGPNNEAYVNGNLNDEGVVFYVYEDTTVKDHTLQVGVRGIDSGLFLYGEAEGVGAALYQSAQLDNPNQDPEKTGDETLFGWKPVAAIASGTEQYYDIDYRACPSELVKLADGTEVRVYQVVLYVRSGMVSFTNLKYKNLTIHELGASQTSYYYDQNGLLQGPGIEIEGSGTSNVDAQNMTVNFASISRQMASTNYTSTLSIEVEEPSVEEPVTVTKPTLGLKYPSLSFEDEILYNVYYTAENTDDVVEMGLITFNTEDTDGTITEADEVIPGYETDGTLWKVATNGISAKALGDQVYFKVYAKLTDGTYVYTDMKSYSAVDYAKTILDRTSSSSYMKALVVSMLNYGAQAQLFFGYNVDSLMNAFLTAEQQALVSAYDESMVAPVTAVDAAKADSLTFDGSSFTKRVPTVSFDGAFAINYYFTTANVPDGDVKLYYWTAEDYANATALKPGNATGCVIMDATDVQNQFWGQVSGIAAKQLDETVFVAGVYYHEGVAYTTGVLNYSIGRYCEGIAANDSSAQQALAQATAVYGFCAKEYFSNL